MIDPRKPMSLVLVAVLAGVLHAQDVVVFPNVAVGGYLIDANGDGLPDDLAAAYLPVLTPVVDVGHGNGTFAQPAGPGESAFPFFVFGDVTGDGLIDAFTASSPDLAVFPGNGDGFGPFIETALPLPPSFLVPDTLLTDMNADGRLDWVALAYGDDYEPSAVVVALATGTASFTLTASIPVTASTYPFEVGDFDADGHPDVVITDVAGPSLEVHLGHGDGSLDSGAIVSPLAPDITGVISLGVGDLDADGKPDLVASAYLADASRALLVLHANGNGTFTTTTNLAVPGYGDTALGDIDGDGWLDVLLASWSESGSQAAVFFNDRAGGLVPGPVTPAPGLAKSVPSLLDVDGDGVLDAVFTGSYEPGFSLSGRGDGSFVSFTKLELPGAADSLVVTDMDGDGHPDLVTSSGNQGPAVELAQGGGAFELHLTGIGGTPRAAGDLDGDGHPDLVLTGNGTRLAFNDGTGTGFASSLTAFSYAANSVALGDVDGDGHLDLLGSHNLSSNLALRRGDGAGGLLPLENVPVGGAVGDFVLADVDANGTLDIVATPANQPMLDTFSGLGTGHFASTVPLPLPTTGTSLQVADLNADGLLDIAVLSGQDADLFLLFAATAGSFGPAQTLDLPEVCDQTLAGDVDRDGRTDLVAVSGERVHLLRGLDGDAFAAAQSHVLGLGLRAAALVDVTGDDRLDVAAAMHGDMALLILPNVLPNFPNLGYQHGASFGTPHLVTTGAPVPDEKVSFTATGVKSPALGALFVGLQFAPTPFAGGTLVPSPDVMLPMRAGVPLAGRWPELPAGTKLYAQAWFAHGAEVAATNAIEAITP